ncbi:MAG: Asp-tRNA(Asn)/Glu-tRNA(Gln) amidotransferase subunit GatB, partial [Armatimonadetes bacterium]|nr:Asp-tRNA(Asn)/Glu-tRNA(Gln) amidotransferase subunit GatB [Armatimonadota bacterium]
GCGTRFGAPPNTLCCPVCLGLPGSLPVPNRRAVEFVIRTALALHCEINYRNLFHRKNYFYPDLPKAYQISQYDLPIGRNGHLDVTVNGATRRIRIRRIHLEEDTGKLLHAERDTSFVDYNRSGVPLMEIVTEPDIHSADEAREYLIALRRILLYIGVSDCRMEQGSMRCEPNISVRPVGAEELNPKAELKNLNSFRVVHLGVQYETARQGLALERQRGVRLGASAVVPGQPPLRVDLSDLELNQETRRWDEPNLRTMPMRTKEYAHDYRYFPEPDLAPLVLDPEWVEEIRRSLPELPEERFRRYTGEIGLSEYDAGLLIEERAVAEYFDAAVAAYGGDAKKIANWMQSDWMRLFNTAGRDWSAVKVTPGALAELVRLQDEGKITGKLAKGVFETAWETGRSPARIVEEQGIQVVGSEDQLLPVIDGILTENERVVADIHKGQTGKVNFLVGQVMRATKGSARPDLVQRLIRERLSLSE